MRTCPECGANFEDGKSFCPSCGKYLPGKAAVPAEAPSGSAMFGGLNAKIIEDSAPLEEALPDACKREVCRKNPVIDPPAKKAEEPRPAEAPKKAPQPEPRHAPKAEVKKPEPVDIETLFADETEKAKKSECPSVLSFLLSVLLFLLPVIGPVYVIALAAGKSKYPAKINLARGMLLMLLIACFIVSAVFLIAVFSFGFDPKPFAEGFWESFLAAAEIFGAKF